MIFIFDRYETLFYLNFTEWQSKNKYYHEIFDTGDIIHCILHLMEVVCHHNHAHINSQTCDYKYYKPYQIKKPRWIVGLI